MRCWSASAQERRETWTDAWGAPLGWPGLWVSAVLYCAALCCVRYCAVLCVLYCAVLYCAVK